MACCSGICSLFGKPRKTHQLDPQDRAKFERIIRFLASVPLFKKQLPRSDLPGVANLLTEKTWQPGEVLCRQGETGKAFFLVFSGQASVQTEEGGQQQERAVLREGDWLGGHTLTSERPNVATVIAKGPEPLVTLQMTKEDFDKSDLSSKLYFPKRPAMRRVERVEHALGAVGHSHHNLEEIVRGPTAGDVEFIMQSISRNPNLKHITIDPKVLRSLAEQAEHREVKKDTDVAVAGELGQEFFIIQQGLFEVICPQTASSGNQKSAEAAVSSASIVERMRRKQNFMMQLSKPTDMSDHRSRSLLVGSSSNNKKKKEEPAHSIVTKTLTKEPAKADAGPLIVATLHEGESFGELSLIYNTRREATFRAATDSVVFVIDRRHFKQLTSRISNAKRFRECVVLLDEVDMLTPLLRSEREELAANVTDRITFKPGQHILVENKVRQNPLWYVIAEGQACVTKQDPQAPGGKRVLSNLYRAQHFGALSLNADSLGHGDSSDVSIDAGPSGVCCLAFDGELIRELMRGIAGIYREAGTEAHGPNQGEFPEMTSKRQRRSSVLQSTNLSLDDLKEVCILGKGGFGAVFLVEDREKNQYALKRISKGLALELDITDQLCWERDLLSMVDSTFLVKLMKTFKDKQFVYLLQDAALGGDLNGIFRARPEVFTEDKPKGSSSQFYVACVIEGLDHLHDRRIVYRDLKLENILLSLDGYGKICDFGLARFVFGKTNTQVGTPDYMAPEMIDPPHYHGLPVDWWALGVLAFELLNRHSPFDDEGMDDQEERLLAIRRSQERQDIHFVRDCPQIARLFIKNLLKKVGEGRLGVVGDAQAVRSHIWFKNFQFDALRAKTLPSPIQDLKWVPKASSGELFGAPNKHDELYVECSVDCENWDSDF